MTDAFFAHKAGELVPAPHAHSPWSADMLHGRLLGGLAARAVEAEHGAPGLHPARLTVDLFKNSPLLPITVETVRVRDGRRIRVADVTLRAGDTPIGRASAVLLREGEQPGGTRFETEPWDEPAPAGPPTVGSGCRRSTCGSSPTGDGRGRAGRGRGRTGRWWTTSR
ncbi:thioesterase family protein [Nonomuraea sp. NBC_01738]|uniref:acyl-CoA thioesterase domain-containing protein n=1 Tax=Nonomuraea sp. NBC_01738 TaxID=2976003 RepID=UPI002E11E418|nr:thioesterase family protein [Nonomuraea sp. NBC_01738]